MQDLYDRADATAVAAAIRDGDVTAEQVVEHAARRLEEHNPRLNAITQVRIEQALQQARAGLPSGPLTGVPFVIKDLGVDVAGMATTNGSRLFRDAVKEQDAELVRRYRRAGLVIVGKTNTPEFGKSASTEPLLYGPTRNPHDPTRSAGGSSGGTAAAIAGGIVPVGHGSDGGGSLRIPAAACGLVGLKPSRGRTPGPTRSGALSSPATVDHVIARSVRDTALLLDVAGGPVAGAGYAAPHRRDDYAGEVGRDPGRCRIAVTTVRPDGRPANEQMAAPTRTVAAQLEALGHEVDEVAPVFPREALMRAFSVLMSVPMVVEIDARLAELGRDLVDDDLEPFTRAMYEHGRGRSGTEVVEALRAVEHCGRALGGFFEEHDALLTPTLAEPTPALGHLDTTDVAAMYERAGTYSAFTSVYNVTGQPAISLPLGHDAQGMPAGVQLVAAFGREDLLLRLAAQLLADGGS